MASWSEIPGTTSILVIKYGCKQNSRSSIFLLQVANWSKPLSFIESNSNWLTSVPYGTHTPKQYQYHNKITMQQSWPRLSILLRLRQLMCYSQIWPDFGKPTELSRKVFWEIPILNIQPLETSQSPYRAELSINIVLIHGLPYNWLLSGF